jgi:hypothetical protein
MITGLNNIPFERLMSYEWVIITHQFGEYMFQNNECFKNGKRLKLIKCGGSIGYKINGKFRSLTWLIANRKPIIKVFIKNVELLPF